MEMFLKPPSTVRSHTTSSTPSAAAAPKALFARVLKKPLDQINLKPCLVPNIGESIAPDEPPTNEKAKPATFPEGEKEKLIELYFQTFTPKQLQAYHIAKDHLDSTFQLEKSNGFLEWKSKFLKTAV